MSPSRSTFLARHPEAAVISNIVQTTSTVLGGKASVYLLGAFASESPHGQDGHELTNSWCIDRTMAIGYKLKRCGDVLESERPGEVNRRG